MKFLNVTHDFMNEMIEKYGLEYFLALFNASDHFQISFEEDEIELCLKSIKNYNSSSGIPGHILDQAKIHCYVMIQFLLKYLTPQENDNKRLSGSLQKTERLSPLVAI